jgi:hypothetical protein
MVDKCVIKFGCFNGMVANIREVVDRIKRLSWSWFIYGEGRNKSLVYSNWWINPCLTFTFLW